ncbi:hypothetical protein [Gemmobacter serpentinus]|uniref:hypothetical protein n=1 Tax=Gemmobacter serpentinus TaxID=2652247 RepID=UPI00124BFC12|nr:hypothetical protein [Gemmobacter serpentinus]
MKRQAPVFLARRSYRLRRLRDGARLLPLAGAFLFLLPIFWTPTEGMPNDTARDWIYLFAIWIALIGLAAILSRGLGTGEEAEAPAGREDAPPPEQP